MSFIYQKLFTILIPESLDARGVAKNRCLHRRRYIAMLGFPLHAVFAHETPTHRSAVHIKKELAGEFLGASDDDVVWSIDAKPARDFIRGGVIT